MPDRFPERLKKRRDDLVEEAEKIGLSHDGCIDPTNETDDRSAKKELNGKVKKLAEDCYRMISNKDISVPRLRASEVCDIAKRKKDDCRVLVRKSMGYPTSASKAGASSGEPVEQDEVGQLTGAIGDITDEKKKIPGTPTKSTVHGSTAEKILRTDIERSISEQEAHTTRELRITEIVQLKEKFLHRSYPFIIGSPDGKVDFTIEGQSFPNALLEIKSTSKPSDIIKDGEIVKTHRSYYQIIVMMEILELGNCLVLVTNDDGKSVHSYARVERDNNFFDAVILPKLREFYVGWLLPEIVHPIYYRAGEELRAKSLGTWVTLPE